MNDKSLLGKIKGIIAGRSDRHSIEKAKGKAVSWVHKSILPNGGLPSADNGDISYQEVTGYMIPTLWRLKEKELAKRLAMWLMSVQNSDGSFSAPDGKPYTFDTGQVLRGLIAVMDVVPNIKDNVTSACDWILTQVEPNGRIKTPHTDLWNLADDKRIPESIHLYVLPPLIEAGRILGRPQYIDAARLSMAYYKNNFDLTTFDTLSHFFGYIMEALLDLGETEMARMGLEFIRKLQNSDGSIPAYSDVKWVCSTGAAQLAVVWLKLGIHEPAYAALKYLCKVQNKSGGFYGSYGKGANYFLGREISWGVKYFLDAYLLLQKNSHSV
jgi:malonyl-CoA O-methyltransferase